MHVSGQREIAFEAGGPVPSEVLAHMGSNLPAEVAGQPLLEMLETPDGHVLVFERARITIQPTQRTLVLSCESLDGDRHHVATMLSAFASVVSDPERTRYRAVLDAGDTTASDLAKRAADLFANVPATLTRLEALDLSIRSIDLTTLSGDDTAGRVRALCAQAMHPDPTDATAGPCAAVCVYPNLASLAVELTRDAPVAVASVAGAFPSGLSSLEVRLADITEAVSAGASEIDVVLNRSAFLSGQHDVAMAELRAMRSTIGPNAMKVILETSELGTPGAISTAAELAMQAGADWIKTSTGKGSAGATPTAALVMAEAIHAHHRATGGAVGLKISGGVRTSADALGYLNIIEHTLGAEWLQPTRVRFGASGLLDAVVADRADEQQ